MNLFTPPKEILEDIVCNKSSFIHYHIFPQVLDQTLFGEQLAVFLEGLLNEMRGFYRETIPDIKSLNCQEVGSVVNEALQNASYHGGKGVDSKIVFGLFLGKQGVCYGFHDEGDYFRQPQIKEQYEGKHLITEFDDSKGKGFHIGVNEHIFPFSDSIFVDTQEGVLYCVQLLPRIQKK